MIAFGARKRIAGWILSGTAGIGRQTVNQDPSTTTQLYEFAVTSPVASNISFKSESKKRRRTALPNGPVPQVIRRVLLLNIFTIS